MKQLVRTNPLAKTLPPEGFHWNVDYLTSAVQEARGFLNEVQYTHLVDVLKDLAREEDPIHPNSVTVEPIKGHDFHELKEKGGCLGKINVRVFFFVQKDDKTIVLLGAINKGDGKTPKPTLVTMTVRKRRYLSGELTHG